MPGIGHGERRFVLLRPQQVDSVYSTVLFDQTREVAVECRLRGLGAGDLNPLTERLQPLLLPKHLGESKHALR